MSTDPKSMIGLLNTIARDPCVDDECGAVAPLFAELRRRIIALRAAIDAYPSDLAVVPGDLLTIMNGES